MSPKDLAFKEYLVQFLSDERKELFNRILSNRTRQVTAVVENVFHPHNISAVLRSCEAFGVQEAHIITERYGEYTVNPDVVVGASKWLNIHAHDSTAAGLDALKAKGYKLVATTPHATQTLDDLKVADKTAFIFGSEALGVSEEVMERADETIVIPMYGFTESFNISVSAALSLRSFVSRMRQSNIDWGLSQAEKDALYLDWTRKSVKRIDMHEKYFEENVWGSKEEA